LGGFMPLIFERQKKKKKLISPTLFNIIGHVK